jgi:Ca-activated chloride channel family protein
MARKAPFSMKYAARPSMLALVAALSAFPSPLRAAAQQGWSSNVVLPQSRVFRTAADAPELAVSHVRADVRIVDGVATTTLDVEVSNPSERDSEAELLLPVPENAVVTHFDFEGAGAAPSARLLPKDEARATYDSIVAKLRDPALLEFAGAALVRSSVFPVPGHGRQKVRVRYEELLPTERGRWDYELVRSASLAGNVSWDVKIDVSASSAIADVYSPTHDLELIAREPRHVALRARTGVVMQPGSLRVSVLAAKGALSTTLFASADPAGTGGWFLLLAGIGVLPPDAKLPLREVTLVIDRSGSMAGEKFDQAKAAARQVIEGLADGEAVSILDYSSDVARFAPTAVIKASDTLPALRAYLDGLRVGGGTNLDGALAAALATPPVPERLPVVLFLTDGRPTEGETRELEIQRRIERDNVHHRRVFTFGVGNDVNAPLLDTLATDSRARARYVRPSEDVERAVAEVFADLSGPVVTDIEVAARQADGSECTRLVRDLYPQMQPDLFRGDRLLLVGRYLDRAPMRFEIRGSRNGVLNVWTIEHDFSRVTARNEFVPRLWAMRRIAALEDSLRRTGADATALAALRERPETKEIVDEMLQLSTRFGVLTDTTAFLALEARRRRAAAERRDQPLAGLGQLQQPAVQPCWRARPQHDRADVRGSHVLPPWHALDRRSARSRRRGQGTGSHGFHGNSGIRRARRRAARGRQRGATGGRGRRPAAPQRRERARRSRRLLGSGPEAPWHASARFASWRTIPASVAASSTASSSPAFACTPAPTVRRRGARWR